MAPFWIICAVLVAIVAVGVSQRQRRRGGPSLAELLGIHLLLSDDDVDLRAKEPPPRRPRAPRPAPRGQRRATATMARPSTPRRPAPAPAPVRRRPTPRRAAGASDPWRGARLQAMHLANAGRYTQARRVIAPYVDSVPEAGKLDRAWRAAAA